MKNRVLRILSCLLVCLFLLAAFAACGEGKSSVDETPTAKPTVSGDTTAAPSIDLVDIAGQLNLDMQS